MSYLWGVVCILFIISVVNAYPEEGSKDKSNSFSYEREKQSPKRRVISAKVECTKSCNYRQILEERPTCFGMFQVDCFISQTFADGHVMETSNNINCLGRFRNTTRKGSENLYIDTFCEGQFEQVQAVNIFEPFDDGHDGVESFATYKKTHSYFNSYGCRFNFTYQKKLALSSHVELAYMTGNGAMTCQGSQTVKIQKDYCTCTRDTCSGMKNEEALFEVDPSAQQMVFKRSAATLPAETNSKNSDDRNPITVPALDVARNFKILAEHEPGLAQQVAEAVVHSVYRSKNEDVPKESVEPVILEYYSSLNIYKPGLKVGPEDWSTYPTTSWTHVLCNGKNAPLSTSCHGVMSANVQFKQAGEAFMTCKGAWRTYDYITYFCKGVFAEEETDYNTFGTFFYKTSRCEGTIAITPLSTRTMDTSRYYGLMEVCNGKTIVQSSYSLEDLDHRYLTNVLDPQDAQQMICLMTDVNCEHLHYLTR